MTESIENALGGLLGGLFGGNTSTGGVAGGGGTNILTSLIKVFMSQGGLQEVMSKLGHTDTKAALASWTGTGANQSVTGDQLENALGTDTIAQVAKDAGVSHDEVKAQLSTLLPQVIDKLSPGGQLPDLGGLSAMLSKFTGK
jgi:uncharacterized protein YidB (DUF937 family)